jgi:ABC-type spermidine/putrescine transport system permease subunit II
MLPLALPGVVAGSIFTFSLTLGDYITPTLVGGNSSRLHRQRRLPQRRRRQQRAVRGRVRDRAVVVMAIYLLIARGWARSRRCEREPRAPASLLGIWTALVDAVPLLPIAMIASTRSTRRTCRAGRSGLSTKWFGKAWHNQAMRDALWLSLKGRAARDAIALVLGSRPRSRVHRFRFFGREAVSFLLVLPIALPGSSPAWR